jgi:hypothetical protein
MKPTWSELSPNSLVEMVSLGVSKHSAEFGLRLRVCHILSLGHEVVFQQLRANAAVFVD